MTATPTDDLRAWSGAHHANVPIGAILPLLREVVEDLKADGQDVHANAVQLAIKRLDWQPLYTAPRDGSWVLIAGPGQDGVVNTSFARWICPPPEASIPRKARELVETYGGYWGLGKEGRPMKRPPIGWMPKPVMWTPDAGDGADGGEEGL